MPFDPLESYHIARDLLTCSLKELALTIGGPLEDACVVWGNITWDNCCPGQLRVAFAHQFPSSRFPNPDFQPTVCNTYERATDYLISVLRCAASPNAQGEPPPCTSLDKEAQIASADGDAIWRAVRCCFMNTDFNYTIRSLDPLGPRGACRGVQLLVTVGLRDACSCSGT